MSQKFFCCDQWVKVLRGTFASPFARMTPAFIRNRNHLFVELNEVWISGCLSYVWWRSVSRSESRSASPEVLMQVKFELLHLKQGGDNNRFHTRGIRNDEIKGFLWSFLFLTKFLLTFSTTCLYQVRTIELFLPMTHPLFTSILTSSSPSPFFWCIKGTVCNISSI